MSKVDEVKGVISEYAGVKLSEVTNNASLCDDLAMDELDHVEVVMALEEKFSIEVSDEEAEKLKTVQDVIDYIDKNQK